MTATEKIKSLIILAAMFLALFCFTLPASAKMFIQTFLDSGTVVVLRENIITLDNGSSYHPLKKEEDFSLDINEGDMVTIRYIIDGNGEKIYSEISPGENSLKDIPTPEKSQLPKSEL